MVRILLKRAVVFGILFWSKVILASPCCGQNSSSLGVMTQGQKLNVSLTQSYASAMGRVYEAKDFFVWQGSKNRVVNITQLGVSYKLKERLQSFLSVAYQAGLYEEGGSQQRDDLIMDTSFGVTYEIFPEYTFSYYKPTVYLTMFANAPTGRSVFEGQAGGENIRVSGHGQWGAGLGLTLNKIILPWTFMVQAKTLRLLAHQFSESSVDGFWDSSVQLLIGYSLPFSNPNWAGLNVTVGLNQLELSERTLSSRDSMVIPNSRSTSVVLGLSKSISENLMFALNYNDQSLLGQPKNTLLSQTFSANLSYNFF